MSAGASGPPRGEGWVVFTVAFLALSGALSVVYGISALTNEQHFDAGGLLWGDLDTWAWVAIVLGALEMLVAWLLHRRTVLGSLLAICLVAFSFIANFMSIGAYPVWSVIEMTLAGVVMWGLMVNLGARAEPASGR
jgi:hypothetical protein